jgi:hypothetical protein
MRKILAGGWLAVALLVAGCGSSEPDEGEEDERPPMKVEDTVFAPVVTAPERVQDRANAAVDRHRESLDRRVEEDEGATREEPAED